MEIIILNRTERKGKNKPRTPEQIEKAKTVMKARYRRLRDEGICYICAKNPVRRNSRCTDCYVAHAVSTIRTLENRIKEMMQNP